MSGRFEGEPVYTAYFYEIMLNGDGEDIYELHEYETEEETEGLEIDDMEYKLICTEFLIDAFDIEACPELEPYHGQYFRLYEDEHGFVSHSIHKRRYYDE